MKTLQQQLQTIKESPNGNSEIDEKLNRLIKVQQRIIDYVSELNNLVSYSCLVELLTYGLMLIALLFMLNIVSVMRSLISQLDKENISQVPVGSIQFILVCNYIFLIVSQSFIWYWHSNEVREESMNISLSAYSTPFIDFTIPMQKKLILIMARAQRPLEIKVSITRFANTKV